MQEEGIIEGRDDVKKDITEERDDAGRGHYKEEG